MSNQEQQIAALKNQVYEEMNRSAELESTLKIVNAKHAGEMSQKDEDLSRKQEEILNLNYKFQEKLDEKQASIERLSQLADAQGKQLAHIQHKVEHPMKLLEDSYNEADARIKENAQFKSNSEQLTAAFKTRHYEEMKGSSELEA
jgi:hypothetical protein